MRIIIEEPAEGQEEELVVRCRHISPKLMQLIAELKAETPLVAYQGAEIHKVQPGEVYYCEAVDNKTFLYTETSVLETKQRLYELEETLGSAFLRVSKSVVLNILRISTLRPALNGRFEAMLDNGELVVISRQYVPFLKEKFGI